MNQKTLSWQPWIAGLLLLFLLPSCFKDSCNKTYRLFIPVYKTLSEVRANMKSNTARDIGRSGKIYIYNDFIFLNEPDKGIHIIDNTNPKAPRQISFVTIPGNVDMAVKGNTLYADSYGDLVTFDISNPRNVVAKKFLNNVFPHRKAYYSNSSNPDSIKVIAEWNWKDTTVDCDAYNRLYETYYLSSSADSKGNYSSPQVGGKGGSMARFTLLNNYLYTVTSADLNVFDISSPQDPSYITRKNVGSNIETIYPFRDKLFIGSNSGMFIYDVAANPSNPGKMSQFSHFTSCDPVVADDSYAYVTLRSGTACQGFTNQLEIVKVTDLLNPTLVATWPLTNPHGLAKDNDLLFICDGKAGLKVYDAKNVQGLNLIAQVEKIDAYDIIAGNKLAIVVASDGLYQFNYFNETNIQLVSKISFIR